MKVFLVVFSTIMLTSCASSPIKVSGSAEQEQLEAALLLHIVKEDSSATWVCYVEVNQHVLDAVSCQNDTALPLFSAGVNESGYFEYAYMSRRLLFISPENAVAYLKMALYPDFTVNSEHIQVIRQGQMTSIEDNANSAKIQVSRL